MKILFFINSLGGGGAEKILTELVNHLDKTKYDITVHTFYCNGIYENQLDPAIHYKTVVPIKNNFLRKCFGRIVWMLLPPRFVYDRFIKNDYDCEVAFLEGLSTKIISMSTQKKSKKIAWVHTDLCSNHWSGSFFRSLEKEKEAYQKFDKIICVSNTVKDKFEEKINIFQNVEVKYNFIDTKIIRERGKEALPFILNDNLLRVISVGRLVEQKGFDRLLKIHRRLIKGGFIHELWIVGDGKLKNKMQKYIDEFCAPDLVKLFGFQENPYKFMAKADIYVCSSRSEGFSLVLAEAMALGVPVISTDCAGPNELIGANKYGVLVSNSEQGLYEGIKKMICDKQMREIYKKRAENRGTFFNIEEHLKEIESVFSESQGMLNTWSSSQ